MAPVAVAHDAHRMNVNAAPASVPADALGTGRSARDLQAALDLRDPGGVLSVYFDHAGRSGSAARDPGRPLAPLVAAARADGHAGVVAVEERIAAVDGWRRARPGTRGVAVFVGVASGRTIEVPLPVAVAPCAAFDQLAHVRGVLDALHRARPAGVVTASAARLAVFEARAGTLVELGAVDLASADRIWRRRRGRRAAPSAPTRQPGPSPDRHARRRDGRLATAAADFGARVAAHAPRRQWDLVVATGNPRLLAAIARRFPAWRTPLIEATAPLRFGEPSALAAAASGEIARIRSSWSSDLITDIVEHPATIWGAEPVMAALERRRVERIVIAADLDANTAERLIRQGLATGAERTLADGGALGPISVAARPRW
jgi:Bacterial archaeo-eukaryotic release factor family 10